MLHTELPVPRAQLLALAEAHGTPLYVYAEAVVRQQCRTLREAVAGLPVRFLYALKANPAPALLRVVADEGFGFDAVSPGEMALLEALGLSAKGGQAVGAESSGVRAPVLFTTTSTTDAELTAAPRSGAVVNLDDVERVDAFGRMHPGAEVCVRFNPGVGAGHHRHVVTGGEESKFGVPLERAAEVAAVAERHGLRVVGLHQHIGSGVGAPAEMWPAVERLVALVPHFPDVRFLDLGGGFGVPYRPGEAALDASQLRADVVEPALAALAAIRGSGARAVELWFEPGRYVVAEAGVLLARVHTLKQTGVGAEARVFAGTDSGFNHLIRPALYDAFHALTNLSHPEGEPRLYDVVGNICESGDLFARQRRVEEIRRGDVLAVLGAGAYGMSMASTYNLRPLPAEVMVGADGRARVVRARQSAEALARALAAEVGA